MSRPTLLTEEVAGRIEQALANGAPQRDAAIYGGISESTFYNWMDRGQKARALSEAGAPVPKTEQPYLEFLESVEAASARPVVFASSKLMDAIRDGDMVTIRWFLERRRPTDFGQHQQVELASAEDRPVTFRVTFED